MATAKAKITPCLWFDGQALEAAEFYCGLFPNSCVDHVQKTPIDTPGNKAGDVLVVEFTLNGQSFSGLNGPPVFQFSEAVSFQIDCADQAEADRFTEALSSVPEAEQCGWVKDRYGLSWQIIPRRMIELLSDPDPARAKRAMEAMLSQKRIDVAAIERAADGN